MRTPKWRCIGTAAGLVAAVAFAHAQSPVTTAAIGAPSPATIRGLVVGAASGEPVRHARVVLVSDVTVPPVLTGEDGAFALTPTTSGHHTILTMKAGFATTESAVTTPARGSRTGDSPAPMATDIEIRMDKSGVIEGRVADEFGEPVPLITVVAERVVRVGAGVERRRAASADTDDLGNYRLFGLPAGSFVVAVAGNRVELSRSHAPALLDYHPQVTNADQADVIEIDAGETKQAIDLVVQSSPRPAHTSIDAAASRRTIRGRVTRSDGVPIRRVRVQLSSVDALLPPSSELTDDDGRYEFAGVRPGSYIVETAAPGSPRTAFGRQRGLLQGEVIIVSGNQPVEGIDIVEPHGGAISGRIVDEHGDPVQHVRLGTARIAMIDGQRRVVNGSRESPLITVETDDRGQYRLFNLRPGRYLVMASVTNRTVDQGAELPGYVRTFFPGRASAVEGQPVEVDVGQDALNVDFAVMRTATHRIAGLALNSNGTPLEGTVSLNVSYRSGAVAMGPLTTRTEADGHFDFGAVLPGEYILQASRANANPSTEGAFDSQTVVVTEGDVTDVILRCSTGSTITGRFLFDGGDPPATAGVELSPLPADGDSIRLAEDPPARADIHEDWTFEMSGIHDARRLRLLHAPSGWTLKAMLVNGLDVTDMPLAFGAAEQSLPDVEVWLSNRVSSIQGTVADDRGRAVRGYTAIAFAVDKQRRYRQSRFVAHSQPDADGGFTFQDLPAADYYVTAIPRRQSVEMNDEIEDPDFIAALVSGARRVRLAQGETQAVTLRLTIP